MSITNAVMRVTSKGQVTIPKPVRDKLNIIEGTEIDFDEVDGRFFLTVKDNSDYWRHRIERTVGTMDTDLSTADIMRLTRGGDWDDGAD